MNMMQLIPNPKPANLTWADTVYSDTVHGTPIIPYPGGECHGLYGVVGFPIQ